MVQFVLSLQLVSFCSKSCICIFVGTLPLVHLQMMLGQGNEFA